MKKIMIKLLSFILPCWKTISSKHVETQMQSILFNRTWSEDGVLVVQQNIAGKQRAFLIKMGRKEPIDMDFVNAFLPVPHETTKG